MSTDTYKTILKPSNEVLFKDKNSKFYGYTFPVFTEKDVKKKLDLIKEKHPTAGHHCYAYGIGVNDFKFRANDDGEPNNSAGMPIYGQIQSFEVTNILIIVVRYFGGVKLGVGGLISAYRTTAQLALEASKIITKTILVYFKLHFNYDKLNLVMRIIKEKQLTIEAQRLELDCSITISTNVKEAGDIKQYFEAYEGILIEEL